MFVGKNGVEQYSSTGNDVGAQRSTYSARRSSLAPSVIDNWSILRKTGARALLPGLTLGQDFEVLPPSVYTAFACWYGGGPAVCRRVIKSSKEQAREDKDSPDGTQTEIEFYPFSVFIVECDVHGKVAGQPREYLFSRTIKVQDAIHELSIERKLDASKIRLWNYAKTNWKEQYIVSPELTLQQANILDEQTILMETSMPDGSWPRSQLHAYLDSEDKQSESSEKVHDAAEVDKHPSPEQEASDSKKGKVRRNNGLVGMDNLGNTCYLNSSLQALLHTDLLVEYFLSQSYLKDINVVNKHGFGGKMANIFGKVMLDLWTTNRDCITPRYFYNEIASLRDQFAGNEQHDAHELLAFLLDALSEDLNMVHSKPYTIQPDSDGRPDHVLADIWWENHLKRDRSVIQALFTGQFKSVMNCSCGYSSARFEPFNFLTVPIPEDSFRVMMVIVVPRSLDQTSRCAVRVPKSGTVENIIEKVKELGFEGMKSGELQYFVAGELVNSRIKSFINLDRKLDTIRDNELLVLFHVTAAPKKMEKYYSKFRTLPTAANGEERRASHGEPSVEEQLKSSSQDSSCAPSVHFVSLSVCFLSFRFLRCSSGASCLLPATDLVHGRSIRRGRWIRLLPTGSLRGADSRGKSFGSLSFLVL
jgi:ubiquitin carboxyl-terminal hydrolase 6/32